MTETLDRRPGLRRLLAIESLVGALVNVTLGSAVAWATFGNLPRVPVWSASGLVLDTLPATFLPALGMAVVLTLVIRKRRKSGALDAHALAPGSVRLGRVGGGLLARAVLLATVSAVIFGAIAIVLAEASGAQMLAFSTVMLLRTVHNALLGAVLAPIVVVLALAEPAAPARWSAVDTSDGSLSGSRSVDKRGGLP